MPSSPDTNLSAVLYSIKNLRLEERPIPQPGPHEVQVAIQKVGICGSDVHYWQRGCIGDFVVKAPMVLGHETSGVISAVGDKVTHLKQGDRVAIEPGVPCRRCEYCKEGRYNLCPHITFCATPPYHGTLTRYYVHAADFCYKLPDHVSLEEGALLEPLSVAVHACRRAGIVLGNYVLVCGAGPIGLVNLVSARAMGASRVVVTDISDDRLKVAKDLGADLTINVSGKDAKTTAATIAEFLGRPVDCTIECSGAETSTTLAIFATKSGGCVVLVGMGAPESKLPIMDALCREVDIRGVFRYVNCYPAALEMVASGRVNVKPLVTHRYSLEQTLEAFETARTGAGGAIKVMIDCSRNQ
ncbi:sorbitol dehydrogenase-like [Paramacrobiotus metropolitanus]|uniref:sorbitol dehydrogenase-like n=1 Tax=Paramacrobiotus metropolitanus TaxID=2943436 RepID=UPI0024457843|nr:sorbitol dehydrogenase-like [Paramacrobiotus metropolitanus]